MKLTNVPVSFVMPVPVLLETSLPRMEFSSELKMLGGEGLIVLPRRSLDQSGMPFTAILLVDQTTITQRLMRSVCLWLGPSPLKTPDDLVEVSLGRAELPMS